MIGWLVLGLAVGFAAGFSLAWLLRGRQPSASAPAAAAPSLAPEPELAQPAPARGRADEEIHQALDATQGLLEELEGRYRGRTAPPDDEARPKRRSTTPRPRRGPGRGTPPAPPGEPPVDG